jgi:hypothetical protein
MTIEWTRLPRRPFWTALKKLESIFSFFYKFQPTKPLKSDPVRQKRGCQPLAMTGLRQ